VAVTLRVAATSRLCTVLRSTCPGVIFPRGHVGLATREKLSGTYVPRTKLTAKRTRPPALESHRSSRRLGRQLPRLADI